ncbi:Permease of the drug/metabolite transporter (DMT) superfamily [Thalassococcus halodurans]|uniref:Permease of the drug/metabolite transporter (DMT) superfamily n=1 Tax=Thalassococcus halodurans TaxID=373675 RepID=A0A1H5UGE5_9RHOB|nr:DMT family transporter [Thalassococcus halodurans]SEF74079.1 Permease of the drug/metabolite transporter (DMT) superfamily [Thalassococcus halodurans]
MSPTRGILLKLGSVALFTVMAALVKAASDNIPSGQAVFFRSLFAMPVIIVWLLLRHDLKTGLKTKNPMGHLWRGLIGVTAMGFTFTGLGMLPLPEVTAIGFAAPLLTVVFAAFLLGERVRAFRLGAVAFGLVGVLIILWPLLSVDNLDRAVMIGVVVVLLSSVFRALAQIQIRRLAGREETSAIVFYFSLTATILSLFTLPFGWVMPTAQEAAMLIGAGLIGGFAQILLTSAYRYAEAGVVAPFDYASMLFAVVLGYVVFAEVPTVYTLVGSGVVIAAGVLIIWRERKLGLKRGQTRKAGLTPQG